jgi:carbamate kinase
MRVVIALGGNALLRRGEAPDTNTQRANVGTAAVAIAEVAGAHEVVVTHGNGPQVGLLALQAEADPTLEPVPLDVLGAETEGMIGYLIEQELRPLVAQPVAALLTQVEVNATDPAFDSPSKPIGPVYAEHVARKLAAERGWSVAPDGAGFRRVVPSPEPQRILELDTIRLLVEAGVLVVCAGGGGIPVVCTPDGSVRGVEAVIDKDLCAALLARKLGADALLLLTDVPAVFADWPEPAVVPIRTARASELREQSFAPGSMGPKVEAAVRFVEQTGGFAGIGALADATRILMREAGTGIER